MFIFGRYPVNGSVHIRPGMWPLCIRYNLKNAFVIQVTIKLGVFVVA